MAGKIVRNGVELEVVGVKPVNDETSYHSPVEISGTDDGYVATIEGTFQKIHEFHRAGKVNLTGNLRLIGGREVVPVKAKTAE